MVPSGHLPSRCASVVAPPPTQRTRRRGRCGGVARRVIHAGEWLCSAADQAVGLSGAGPRRGRRDPRAGATSVARYESPACRMPWGRGEAMRRGPLVAWTFSASTSRVVGRTPFALRSPRPAIIRRTGGDLRFHATPYFQSRASGDCLPQPSSFRPLACIVSIHFQATGECPTRFANRYI